MKYNITIGLLVLILKMGLGQKINDLTKKSDQHELIKGTNISLVPPVGFKESASFKGFQDPTNPYSMVMVMEIPGPFNAISAGFESDKMITKGMVLTSKKEIKVNNFKGYLVGLTQKSGGLNYAKHIVIYGDSSNTAIINGVYLADSTDLGNRILASLKTIFIDDAIEKNPREELDYIIDESDTDFVYNAVIGNATMFIYKKPHNEIISYFVDASFAASKATDKKQFCINRLAQYDQKYQFIKAKGINEISIAGMKGYELYGQSLTDKNEQIFQTIVFDEDDYYYIFCGIYPINKPELIQQFKKINSTLSVK
jgi:hypothetical protein